MAFYDWGNISVNSTTAQPVSNPSTATLVAVVDSTQLGTFALAANQHVPCMVTALLGADTSATWQVEISASSTLADQPAYSWFIKTPTGQSGQYMLKGRLTKDSRVRARVNSTFTGSATASLSVERLT